MYILFLLENSYSHVNKVHTKILCRCLRKLIFYSQIRFSRMLVLDIDECLNGDNLCEHGQCTNKAGSYECECELGYIPDEDKKSCVGKTTS